MKPLLPEERRARILRRLAGRGRVLVAELARDFGVHPVTVRRDLAVLEAEGHLRRVHGGAVAREAVPLRRPSEPVARRIAEAAARFIPDGVVVCLGVGPLTTELLPYLEGRRRLTVITNGVEVAWALSRSGTNTVHLIGGQVAADGGAYGGEQALAGLRADLAVVEGGGLEVIQGLTHHDARYAAMARAFLSIARRRLALVHPAKVGGSGAIVIAPAEELDMLVTGREADNAPLWDLSEVGLRIVLA